MGSAIGQNNIVKRKVAKAHRSGVYASGRNHNGQLFQPIKTFTFKEQLQANISTIFISDAFYPSTLKSMKEYYTSMHWINTCKPIGYPDEDGSALQIWIVSTCNDTTIFQELPRSMDEYPAAVSARSGEPYTAPHRLFFLQFHLQKITCWWVYQGIAVSGGPDSMALAYLCRQLQITRPELKLDVTAFVVDHKLRDESTEEAQMVAKWLSNLGIST